MLKALTRGQLRDGASADMRSKKRRGKEKKRKQKKKTKAWVAMEEEKAETSKASESEITKLAAANRVEISDNIVLRKLLRGPRYFNPPDSVWRTCYNCGEGGHTTASCSSVKRKKPCFVCGSLEHNGKQCEKGRDCFICEKGGHLAKNCPEKYIRGSQNSKLCLKCGDFCHDMFSCNNDYSPDDLKEIQCYICNSFGHLCCAAFGDFIRREPSCYRCGQLGHTGLECQRSRGERTSVGPLSACIKCGEGGHFALECTSSTKAHKRNLDLATPPRKFHKGNRETVGVRSVPSDSGKSQERKMGQYEGGRFSTPPNAIQSDGWITQYPGDLRGYAQVPGWGSPVIPTYNGNLMGTPIADGHASSSYSLRRAQELHFGPLASNVSPLFYQNIYSPSIYDNFSSYGTRSNYYW